MTPRPQDRTPTAALIDHTKPDVVRAEAERRTARRAAGLPLSATDDRAEVLRLAQASANRASRRCKAARKPRTGAARTSAPPKRQNADKRVPSEHEEQAEFFARVRRCRDLGVHPAFAVTLAIPNGGHRSKRTAARMKLEGVEAGAPDTFTAWPAADGSAYGLWLEFKRRNASPSAVKASQHEWHDRLRAAGYAVRVCRGADEAWQAITEYLGITLSQEDAA